MTRIIMSGCTGKMGRVITAAVKEKADCKICGRNRFEGTGAKRISGVFLAGGDANRSGCGH